MISKNISGQPLVCKPPFYRKSANIFLNEEILSFFAIIKHNIKWNKFQKFLVPNHEVCKFVKNLLLLLPTIIISIIPSDPLYYVHRNYPQFWPIFILIC